MQLDRTHVAIRVRSLSEIGDLALVMVRQYPASLLVGFAVGAAPWVIANALLLGEIPWREAAYGFEDPDAAAELYRYLLWMATLVTLQTPAAGLLMTYYLGQAVFERRPTWQSGLRELARQWPRCTWVFGVKRLAIPAMVLVAIRWGQPVDGFFDGVVPIGLLVFVAAIRSSRPFLPEILLLEQCPTRPTAGQTITVARRAKSLHRPMSGELSGRYLAVSFVLLFLMLSVYYTIYWARGIAIGVWRPDFTALFVFYPLSLWIVAGLSVIIRLLGYLDTRIRLEGWEVELALRAEAIRQFGGPDEGSPSRRESAPGTGSAPEAELVPGGEAVRGVAGGGAAESATGPTSATSATPAAEVRG